MDSKRVHTTGEAMRRQARLALRQIEEFKPNVVVVLDDNAIREVMLPLVGRDDIAVVFSGMNGQPRDYHRLRPFLPDSEVAATNVTGVYEKLYVGKSLSVFQAAVGAFEPGQRLVVITDYTPTGNAITRQFSIELQDADVKWELQRVRDLAQYQQLILRLNEDPGVAAIYPAALALAADDGEVWTAPRIFAWTTKYGRKPELALNYFFSKLGLFGGAAVDFHAMGKLAGHKVAAILQGARPADLPVEDAPDYAIVFNLARARQLGVDIPQPLLTAADLVYQ
jgi:hypothetical protein